MGSGEAKRVALIQAIGTANPPNCFLQDDYPEFYFQLTKSQHMIHLKDKFKRICGKTRIKKRYMHLTEDIIEKNPNIGIYGAPSLDARRDILVREIPNLGMEASLKAIQEWGHPTSSITHLIFCTSSEIGCLPSADHQLAKLIGLKPSVQKFMIYNQGCFAAGTALRLAKDLAENNADAQVLVVCCEIHSLVCFHAPSETHLDILVGSAIFSDGAAAVIVSGGGSGSCESDTTINRRPPLFHIISAIQTEIPDSDEMIVAKIRETGMQYYLSRDLPQVVSNNIEQCLIEMFAPFGIENWNKLFYTIHTGGPAILRGIEEKLGLAGEKLGASWRVLSEYGNMGSASVLFALDALRRKSVDEGKPTTGEGLELGVLLGFGPGLTVETVGLRSFALEAAK
ncbi:TRANSPARENT TESTA 4, CHALCONE SYNTHASE [Hibiscus trionum]|uniref:TRANSPARENT TESTA 4, CHALCONE SYNTHASE n=1 Tax=Hibiscus trionum TaxID=183268 RepID=A0A9W7MEV9_HIBTR|nr:TRANSPARENT TESTA 4, CHALCONE SYNTHASE [Hibiscus trionum]